ncbi:hypothetical protein SASPL_148112 [Salvia splendens]|uniref:F-box domain-containing protein n=1 Tax=Salvia splendens TaxID=180675 RepID=A0A8X8W9G9_SALSN|nr:F-box/LRR-repeat protein At3g26922-like [Salvia splendens]KAG6390378.1 hypothetical protein SASPL_148112 [Salvia splendens]
MAEDRISQLPDEILQHVLSFIDIYEVVETTILSKRWKNLWRSLLNIRLHIRSAAAYRRRVFQFLSHRNAAAPLHGFHLSLDNEIRVLEDDEAFVEECVLYAINHSVQSLRLHDLTLSLPAAVFTSTTLRELELRQRDTRVYVPGRFSLPNLKTLYLEAPNLNFSSDQGKELCSGLPELEKLSLRGFSMPGLVLKAPKLRVLEILESNSLIIQEISAPLLTSFRYEGFSPLECLMMNLPMLEEVYVDILSIKHNVKGLQVKCARMLQQLGNTTTVSLTLDTLECLDGGPIDQSPPFPNIKCLKVMKGRHKLYRVRKQILKYLTVGTLNFESLTVEFPAGVIMDERNSDNEIHYIFLFC